MVEGWPPDVQFFEHIILLRSSAEKRGCSFRMEDATGMRIEREYPRFAFFLLGDFNGRLNNGGMADVQSIKITKCEA